MEMKWCDALTFLKPLVLVTPVVRMGM